MEKKNDREILFRGKRFDNGEWIEGIPIKTHIGLFMCYEENPHYCSMYGYMEIDQIAKVNETTVCQYTGISDKNGEKIYERDIVKRKLFGEKFIVGQVVWLDIGFCGFYLKCGNSYYPIGKDEHTKKSKCDKIIGNIFDNPKIESAN